MGSFFSWLADASLAGIAKTIMASFFDYLREREQGQEVIDAARTEGRQTAEQEAAQAALETKDEMDQAASRARHSSTSASMRDGSF